MPIGSPHCYGVRNFETHWQELSGRTHVTLEVANGILERAESHFAKP